ncbi:hypothetical protein FSP39_022035 [Pinctada imbricata]|uniref:guanylate cyclase n=1 Tax=Pinctada imbricata TaxID=66713 RepID=A0AA88YEE6_PINIB|nr:hypothetical protein FSP39_022035 [Pinctada imbricata]
MYGMLLESIQYFVQKDYGQTKWQQVLEHAGIKNMVFTTHAVYSDETMQNLATSCACVLKDKTKEGFFQYFGQCFVLFFSNYGYDKIMRVAGRNYRDFLHEIDNLHEMMRYSYSKMRSPSFLVVSEDSNGCILRYRSKRKGFQNYVIGQLTQCAYRFYQINVSISVLTEETLSKGCDITFRLDFDNSAHMQCKYSIANGLSYDMFGIISSDIFFKVFPFCIVFDKDLTILRTGHNMSSWLDTKDLIGSHIDARFTLKRPLLEFTWNNIMSHQGVTFELQYTSRTRHRASITVTVIQNGVKHAAEGIPSTTSSHRVGSLEDMRQVGLYLNDLNLFDNSRHMVIDGWHHASQLEDLVEQQKDHSHQISENMKKLDDWKNKSDALLYSMIPESIACRLKQGEDPINTCETFDQVTILFSYIVGFADICTMASPMDIVRCINSIFSTFDAVIDKYNVFKVETLGDAVYMVAGGVPDRKSDHAVSIAGLALELVETAVMLKDPVSGGHLQLRAGMHTGGVVAGIIGKRMPQYCLFGDTVNTASRMQSYSEVRLSIEFFF